MIRYLRTALSAKNSVVLEIQRLSLYMRYMVNVISLQKAHFTMNKIGR